LELAEQVVEPVESGVPGALERAHPVVDRLERRTVDPVPAMPSVGAHEHETDGPQHGQVLGHLWLAEAESIDELTDRGLLVAQRVEEVTAARLGDGVERVRCRRGASHSLHYMSISTYVKRGEW